MSELKLKPCPFCGGEAVLMKVTFTAGMSYYVRCGNGKCAVFPITKSYSTDDEAIEVWNMRANDDHA